MSKAKYDVLVVGAGGREHALIWKLAQSKRAGTIYCAPGSDGISQLATCKLIAVDDIDGLFKLAQDKQVDLCVVGPELPLSLGIVDRFQEAGIKIVGPCQAAAQMESSKAFSKQLMQECQVPTADFYVCDQLSDANDYIHTYFQKHQKPLVVKADGLAAGKGVVIAQDKQEALETVQAMLSGERFGKAGKQVVLEEFLSGPELSCIILSDGEQILAFPSSRDHKTVFEANRGPNTGGMGAYSPVPEAEGLYDEIMATVFQPVLAGLKERGIDYQGFLYAGLMLTPDGLKVIEFNVRMGDPEAQVLFMRLASDLLDILLATAEQRLDPSQVHWDERSAICTVLAAGGYPASYEKGIEINGLDGLLTDHEVIFHAGTVHDQGIWKTMGGRVLNICAWGDDLQHARRSVYERIQHINWDAMHFRKDIGEIHGNKN